MNKGYVLLKTRAEGEKLNQELMDTGWATALDTETMGVDPTKESPVGKGRAILVSIYCPRWNLPRVLDGLAIQSLKPFLLSKIPKILANAKFDMHILSNMGLHMNGLYWDTVTADALIDENRLGRHGLKKTAQDYLGYKLVDLLSRDSNTAYFYHEEYERFVEYAAEDALATYAVAEEQERMLNDIEWRTGSSMKEFFIKYLMPFELVLWKMERRGIQIDTEFLTDIMGQMNVQIDFLEAKAYEVAGEKFNVNSVKQKTRILYDKLGIKPNEFTNTKTCAKCGKPATKKSNYICAEHGADYLVATPSASAAALGKMKHPLAKILTQRGELVKLRDYCKSYIKHTMPWGRLHCNFRVYGARTGRLSSSLPNLQNVPARESLWGIRRAFTCLPEMRILGADYDQLEYMITAELSQDPTLLKIIQDGVDIHSGVTKELFHLNCDPTEVKMLYPDMRKKGKQLNFGILYGMGPKRLAENLGITITAAKDLMSDYFDRFPTLTSFIEHCQDTCERQGFVTTIAGRRRNLPDIYAMDEGRYAAAKRQSFNSIVQGCKAADSKVLTVDGFMSLRNVREQHPLILTATGQTDEYIVHQTGKRPCFRIETTHGSDVVTADHRFFAPTLGGGISIQPLKNFTKDDWILIEPRIAEGGSDPIEASPGIAEIIGILCGDGNYSRDRDFRVCYGNNHTYGKIVASLIKQEFNCHCAIRESKRSKGESFYIDVPSKGPRQILLRLGLKQVSGIQKKVPDWILTGSLTVRTACLRGLYDTDGGVVSGKFLKFTSTSENLARSFYLLSHSLGVPCFISKDHNRTPSGKEVWRVTVRAEYARDFLNKVKPRVAHKREINPNPMVRLPSEIIQAVATHVRGSVQWKQRGHHSASDSALIYRMWKFGGGTRSACQRFLNMIEPSDERDRLLEIVESDWAQIKEIIPIGSVDTMDIEIFSEDHSYIGEGLLQHNSASDIIMAAMLKIEQNKQLKELGARLLLQIHDEIVMEVPKENAQEAAPIVKKLLEKPFKRPLSVPLNADPEIGMSWKEAKD